MYEASGQIYIFGRICQIKNVRDNHTCRSSSKFKLVNLAKCLLLQMFLTQKQIMYIFQIDRRPLP